MSVILGFQFTQPKRAATFFINLHPSGYKFQFTQPKRAATRRYFYFARGSVGFNSRSPSGLRLAVANYRALWVCFNSRSPSGLRPRMVQAQARGNGFQFTQPKWAATLVTRWHSLTSRFQFTQPKRAATSRYTSRGAWRWVSIHAAQAGCDYLTALETKVSLCFNSRSPSGLRPLPISLDFLNSLVSIHAAQAGCDGRQVDEPWALLGFQFTQPKRAATTNGDPTRWRNRRFNSRSPSGLRRVWCRNIMRL